MRFSAVYCSLAVAYAMSCDLLLFHRLDVVFQVILGSGSRAFGYFQEEALSGKQPIWLVTFSLVKRSS